MRLINVKHCKDLALKLAGERAQPFTRVSKDFLERVEGRLRNVIIDEVKKHPSRGTTLK